MALSDHDGEPEPFVNAHVLAPERRRRSLDPESRRPEPGAQIVLELDCLRGHIASLTLQAATYRSRRLGIGADRVLIEWGAHRRGNLSPTTGGTSWHRFHGAG